MINFLPVNYLRTRRRPTGLTQEELGFLLGKCTGSKVARYERSLRVPNLANLISYEYLFDATLQTLFPGIAKVITAKIRRRACSLRNRIAKRGEKSNDTTRKLEFLSRFSDSVSFEVDERARVFIMTKEEVAKFIFGLTGSGSKSENKVLGYGSKGDKLNPHGLGKAQKKHVLDILFRRLGREGK